MTEPQDRTELLPELTDFVAGRTQPPTQLLPGHLCDPNTGLRLQQQVQSGDEVIDEALAFAADLHASGTWSSTGLEQRAKLLDKVGNSLRQSADRLAVLDAQTTGVVINLTRRLAAITGEAFRTAARQLRGGWMVEYFPGPHSSVELVRKPLGPAAIISPWNAPTPITAHKVASALAAGCPVIIKPSEWSPHSSDVIAEACEVAGLPRGLVQVVHGAAHAGGRVVSSEHVRAVSFTGGTVAGRRVAEVCASQLKPAQLELGGNNAMLVLEDADITEVVEGIVTGMTTLNGQWCRALGRLIVHESRVSEVMERALQRLAQVRLGSSLDPSSDMGPVIHAGHLQLLRDAITKLEAAGGEALTATPLPDLQGHFLAPTLVRGAPPEAALAEMFGPVASVHTFGSDDEAVALANRAPYGLAGYVYSSDEERAWAVARRLETGMVKINGVTMLSLNPDAPRPAWKLSGLGHEGARDTIEFFSGDSVIGVAGRARTTQPPEK